MMPPQESPEMKAILTVLALVAMSCGGTGPDDGPSPPVATTDPDAAAVCAAARDNTVGYCVSCLGRDLAWCQEYGWFVPCDGTRPAAFTDAQFRAICSPWWNDRLASCDLADHPSGEPPSCTNPFDPGTG